MSEVVSTGSIVRCPQCGKQHNLDGTRVGGLWVQAVWGMLPTVPAFIYAWTIDGRDEMAGGLLGMLAAVLCGAIVAGLGSYRVFKSRDSAVGGNGAVAAIRGRCIVKSVFFSLAVVFIDATILFLAMSIAAAFSVFVGGAC